MYLAQPLYQLIGDTFLRTGTNLLHDFYFNDLTQNLRLYTNVHDSEFTQVTAVTIIIYMARKVHTAYMFLECFEARQVSELTTDF